MKKHFEAFENIYWVSGEDKNYEVLVGVVRSDLGNGMYEILCNNTVYEVKAHRLFKPEYKEDAIEFANDLIGASLMNYRTWMAYEGYAQYIEQFKSEMAELQLVKEKNKTVNIDMEEQKINFCVDCVYMRDVTFDPTHTYAECVCRKNNINYVTGQRLSVKCKKIRENKPYCEHFEAKPLKWHEKLFKQI